MSRTNRLPVSRSSSRLISRGGASAHLRAKHCRRCSANFWQAAYRRAGRCSRGSSDFWGAAVAPVFSGFWVGGLVAVLALGAHDETRTSRGDQEQAPRADVVFGSAHAGACLNWPTNTPGDPSFVPCEDDHLFEVAESFDMHNSQAPCQRAVQRYLGTHYDPNSRFTVTALWPDEAAATQTDGQRPLCGLQLLGPDS